MMMYKKNVFLNFVKSRYKMLFQKDLSIVSILDTLKGERVGVVRANKQNKLTVNDFQASTNYINNISFEITACEKKDNKMIGIDNLIEKDVQYSFFDNGSVYILSCQEVEFDYLGDLTKGYNHFNVNIQYYIKRKEK